MWCGTRVVSGAELCRTLCPLSQTHIVHPHLNARESVALSGTLSAGKTKRLESLSAAVFGDERFKVHSNLILYLYVEFSFVAFVCLRC